MADFSVASYYVITEKGRVAGFVNVLLDSLSFFSSLPKKLTINCDSEIERFLALIVRKRHSKIRDGRGGSKNRRIEFRHFDDR